MIEFKHLQQTLEELGEAIKNRYKENLSDSDRKASYNLINSVKYHTVINGYELSIDLEMEDYWKYVEWDTKPHWPPIDKILEWVKIKPVLPTPMANGKLPTERQLAFLISRAIAGESPNQAKLKNPKGGTTGSHDLESTMEEIDQKWEEKIVDALDADVMGNIDEILMFYK